MEERREIHARDVQARDLPQSHLPQAQDFPQLPNLGLLIAVIVAAFVAIGATVYFFGEDQTGMTAANNSLPQSERMMKAKRPPMTEPGPVTTGQGGAQ